VNDAEVAIKVDRLWLGLGAAFAFTGVLAGSVATRLFFTEPGPIQSFEAGARYQVYHALALLFVAILAPGRRDPLIPWAGWLFVVGIIVFSGSQYFLGLTGSQLAYGVTRVGGIFFLPGWGLLLYRTLFPARE